jgi:hypothetical protein
MTLIPGYAKRFLEAIPFHAQVLEHIQCIDYPTKSNLVIEHVLI